MRWYRYDASRASPRPGWFCGQNSGRRKPQKSSWVQSLESNRLKMVRMSKVCVFWWLLSCCHLIINIIIIIIFNLLLLSSLKYHLNADIHCYIFVFYVPNTVAVCRMKYNGWTVEVETVRRRRHLANWHDAAVRQGAVEVPRDFNISARNLRPIETTFTYRPGTQGPQPYYGCWTATPMRFLVWLCYVPRDDRRPIRNQPTRPNHPPVRPHPRSRTSSKRIWQDKPRRG